MSSLGVSCTTGAHFPPGRPLLAGRESWWQELRCPIHQRGQQSVKNEKQALPD